MPALSQPYNGSRACDHRSFQTIWERCSSWFCAHRWDQALGLKKVITLLAMSAFNHLQCILHTSQQSSLNSIWASYCSLGGNVTYWGFGDDGDDYRWRELVMTNESALRSKKVHLIRSKPITHDSTHHTVHFFKSHF